MYRYREQAPAVWTAMFLRVCVGACSDAAARLIADDTVRLSNCTVVVDALPWGGRRTHQVQPPG